MEEGSMGRRAVALALLFLLIASLASAGAPGNGTPEVFLSTRLPIRIDGDYDFTAANGVTGGSGTAGDPWLIENWDISGHGYGYCIYIGNTTEHFIIRNCDIHDARQNFAMYYYTESGVILHNVANGAVSGNSVHANDFDGVYLHGCSNVTVEGNGIAGNRWGVMLMGGSHNNTIRDNTVNESADYGIGMIESTWNRALGNRITGNTEMGIFLGDSERNTMSWNDVSGNGEGIVLEGSEGNTISCNNITLNTDHGLRLWASAGNRLHHNNIMGNGKQARDDSGANSWDNGFPSGGNHWSDYSGMDANNDGLGDSAYGGIAGGMGARDRYPFMMPWFPDTEPPVAVAGPDRNIDEGTVVRFNSSGSTDNVGVAVYTWAFEFGGTEKVLNGPAPEFNFTVPGIYAVTLEARDSAGNRGTDSLSVNVNDMTPPVADAGPDISVDEGGTANLDGSRSHDNQGITAYTWNFNDGLVDVELQGREVSHVFQVAGAYTVALTVSDLAGHRDTDTMTVTVVADTEPPLANAGGNITVMAGGTVRFNGTGSTDNVGIIDYSWLFTHNGTALNLHGPTPEFVFWEIGNHTVALTVADARGNSATDSVTVTVSAPGQAQGPDGGNETVEKADAPGIGWAPAAAATGIVLALALAAIFILMRRRR